MWTKEVNTNVSVSTGQLYCGNKQPLNSLASPTKIFFFFQCYNKFCQEGLSLVQSLRYPADRSVTIQNTAYDMKRTESFLGQELNALIQKSSHHFLSQLIGQQQSQVYLWLNARGPGSVILSSPRAEESQKKLVNSINNLHKSITLPSRQFLYILLSSHFHFCLNH